MFSAGVGSKWAYKDHEYTVTQSEKLEMKDASDGNWQDAIAYTRSDGANEGRTYVRSVADFASKFKPA